MKRVQAKYKGKKIDATGHSLGGSTAIAVGRYTGVPVTAFNPGGSVIPFLNPRKCATCTIIIAQNDPISASWESSADVVIKGRGNGRSTIIPLRKEIVGAKNNHMLFPHLKFVEAFTFIRHSPYLKIPSRNKYMRQIIS